MHSLKLAAAAFAFCLVACGGGQPTLYDVAIDQSPLNSLPATCFRDGKLPSPDTVAVTNGFVEQRWNLWGGTDKQYLDIGTNTFGLGDANAVQTGGNSASALPRVIGGGPTAFTETRVLTRNSANPVEVDTRTVTVTFDSNPGDTATGTIAIKSDYTCSGCGQPSCDISVKFVGRKINSSTTTLYNGG